MLGCRYIRIRVNSNSEGKQTPVRVSEGIDLSRSIEYSVFHVNN